MSTSIASSRAVLRQSRFFGRRTNLRQASTASETASKAKETASSATSKASQGLSRVTSSAGPAISGALSGARNALGRVGGRTGRLIAFVESLIPPTVYYGRVGLELSKIVFQAQRMSPPSSAAFRETFQPLINAFRTPRNLAAAARSLTNGVSLRGALATIRNVNRQQLANAGVASAEILGFFTVGSMIGRFKVVGYRGETGHEEH